MRRGRQAGQKQSSGFGFNVLSPDEIYDIHLATLEVLETTGVLVMHPEAVAMLEGAGAGIDDGTGTVKIPPYMVEDALRSCPPKLTLYGRSRKHDVSVEKNRIAFANFGGAVNVVDVNSDEIRPFRLADLAACARLVDALDEIDLYKPPGNAQDAPQNLLQVHSALVALTNTTKPFYMGGGSRFQTRKLIEMAAMVMGGAKRLREHPNMLLSACPTSPLKLGRTACEVLMECAGNRLPVSITSMAMAGASAPVTLAGALIVHNVEVLAAVVLHQLTAKGAPVTYGCVTTTMDLVNSIAPIGSPEISMVSAAVAQMARYYKLPSNVGGGSDSKLSDGQAAHEMTLTAMLPALAGANIITGAGILESGMTLSGSKLLLDCEIIRMIQHVVGGITVNDDTMALDVIEEIGAGGSYLEHDHTFAHMRTVQARPRLIDRRTRKDWEQQGRTTIYERARDKTRQILADHRPDPLPDGLADDLQRFVAETEKEVAASAPSKR